MRGIEFCLIALLFSSFVGAQTAPKSPQKEIEYKSHLGIFPANLYEHDLSKKGLNSFTPLSGFVTDFEILGKKAVLSTCGLAERRWIKNSKVILCWRPPYEKEQLPGFFINEFECTVRVRSLSAILSNASSILNSQNDEAGESEPLEQESDEWEENTSYYYKGILPSDYIEKGPFNLNFNEFSKTEHSQVTCSYTYVTNNK